MLTRKIKKHASVLVKRNPMLNSLYKNVIKGKRFGVFKQRSTSNDGDEFNSNPEVVRSSIEEITALCGDRDKDHIWAFCSGLNSMDFRGNPKFLYIYINNYRPDIFAFWMCEDSALVAKIREMGLPAFDLNDSATYYLLQRTGVLVAEVVKAFIPQGMENVKFLNLWHGVGFKRSERKLFEGDIALGIAQRYVSKGTYYRDNQLLLTTSPSVEAEFLNDFGVDEDKYIRTGYPRCEYQNNFEPFSSFDHNLREIKGLPETTRLAVFAPTYRAQLGGTFATALPDLDRLYDLCERENILLIFKVHPRMENEAGFINAQNAYADKKYFWFWNNEDDFYEILNEIDLAIIDYSSIVSDMVAVGIKHYIRYVYDFEEYMESDELSQGKEAYLDKTLGKMCFTYDELLSAIENYESYDDTENLERLKDRLWQYAKGKDDFDLIIDKTIQFNIEKRDYPTLYSFDIFDTLISRKVLEPRGIFYYVKERMLQDGTFPISLSNNYPSIRHTCENNVRELYRKTEDERKPGMVEITFRDIFNRMKDLYALDENQIEKLMSWEMEAEYDNTIPLTEQINLVKALKDQGNEVVLISDMYLPKDFISKMLAKADPFLATLPLFVSSEYGVQKTSRRLFFEVYKSFEPYYDFEKWVHFGDNKNADETQPRKFGIKTRKIARPSFNDIQNKLTSSIGTYNSFLLAALQARMRQENVFERDSFVISFIALCLVPYVDWAVRDAISKGYETLYFISRDGHHLKRIADAIIKAGNLPIKTKYIYGSRRAWRIPSFIDHVDEDFYNPRHGNFVSIKSKEKLLRAMDIDEEGFNSMFPGIDLSIVDFDSPSEVNSIIRIVKESLEYNDYLLRIAAEKRTIVEDYFRQEIDSNEKFAFVEYWGRGYTQDNFRNLWNNMIKDDTEIAFYYCRSILPSIGNSIRYNFTSNDSSFFFMEGIFANIPYKSVETYVMKDGKVVPELEPVEYDKSLFDSMQRLLPEFAERYTKLDIDERIQLDRMAFEFALDYFKNNRNNLEFANQIGSLVDSVTLFGDKREFAPGFTEEMLDLLRNKVVARNSLSLTSSITMSYVRTSEENKAIYREMYQLMPGENITGGRLLNENEILENRLFKEKYETSLNTANHFASLYNEAIREHDIEPGNTIIISKGNNIDNRGLNLLYQELISREMNPLLICTGLKEYKKKELAELLAKANFIVMDNPIELLSKTLFRPETKVILAPENAFRLFNRGLKERAGLKNIERFRRLISTNDISGIQMPSEYQKNELVQFYTRRNPDPTIPVGCNITDIYFQPGKDVDLRNKIETDYPELKGKKIILYIPTIRFKDGKKDWALLLDMERLHSLIGDEYAVIINLAKADREKVISNPLEVPGFSKLLNTKYPLRQLLLAADIIVGDYRDAFFESVFMHKPVYSTATDYEAFTRNINITEKAQEFNKLLFCPLVSSSDDLAKEISHIDQYDYSMFEGFRNEMFSYCDGHSVKRMADYICNESIASIDSFVDNLADISY